MRFAGLAIALLALPVAAHAETIDVRVQRPAVAGDVFLLRSLAIDRFYGTDGRAMANELERELARLPGPDGGPMFEMFAVGAGEGDVSGQADVDVVDGRYVEKRRLCPGSFDPKAKCDDAAKTEIEVNCRTRAVSLEANVRIVRTEDGRVLMNRDVPQRSEARWCNGDRTPTPTQDVVAMLIRRAVEQTTADFVPFSGVLPIRIREDRKGLDKTVGAQFKAAVEATRGDGSEGCGRFAALEASIPTHRALIFNLALCAEAVGDYIGAIDGYRRVGDREAQAAADRAGLTEVAIKQARARQEP